MSGCLKSFFLVAFGVPAAAAAAIAFYLWWNDASAHYRLTLSVETDGVVHIGSGVWSVNCSNWSFGFDNPDPLPCAARGEAIPIDLGAGGLLFVTLRGQPVRGKRFMTNPVGQMLLAFPQAFRGGRYANGLEDLKKAGAHADVPLDRLPLLVRFGDPKDPKSVEAVDPQRLDQTYGPGALIVRATIAMTDDPVTTGIEKILPWMTKLSRYHLDGTADAQFLGESLAHQLGGGYFKEGID